MQSTVARSDTTNSDSCECRTCMGTIVSATADTIRHSLLCSPCSTQERWRCEKQPRRDVTCIEPVNIKIEPVSGTIAPHAECLFALLINLLPCNQLLLGNYHTTNKTVSSKASRRHMPSPPYLGRHCYTITRDRLLASVGERGTCDARRMDGEYKKVSTTITMIFLSDRSGTRAESPPKLQRVLRP